MSEYQYYEFAAIDGPISDEGLRYARGCSSRANVSRVRWQNTYTFGDFHGSVNTLLKHYDAHFYIANWGTVRLGLVFPKGAVSPEAIRPYLWGGKQYEDTLTVKEIGNRCIVWWERDEEGGWGWTEGEGLIDQLIGVREELMRGDYRALFLGWLADFDPDDWRDAEDGAVVMPPIPAGLDHLSPPLAALIKHFPVDPDVLAVAAGLSQASTAKRIPIAAVLERFPVSEMRALLARVAEGGGAGVMAELNRLTYPRVQNPVGQAMKCTDFAAKTIETRDVRHKQEAEAASAKRQREAKLRKQHLASILRRADTIWSGLDPLMDQKIASAYDQAAAQLQELRDAYAQAGDIGGFQQKLNGFRLRYSNRPAMLRRIEEL
ncbi:MAG TPA: hypothetical protein VFD66_12570 [Verrucomicrobiae bacterium]|nr:hypothetical protein [Verrucomicrobiae bacterium]